MTDGRFIAWTLFWAFAFIAFMIVMVYINAQPKKAETPTDPTYNLRRKK